MARRGESGPRRLSPSGYGVLSVQQTPGMSRPVCLRSDPCRTRSRIAVGTSMRVNACGIQVGVLPNGSRLSCGRKAWGRKVVGPQTKGLDGERTQFFLTLSARQLQ